MTARSTTLKGIPFRKYVTLPGETLLLATRTHPLTPVLSFTPIGITFLLLGASNIILLTHGVLSLITAAAAFIFTVVIAGMLALLMFFEWRSHYYVVTSRKLLEVRGIPFFYHKVNGVLLDQVRCTEIDVDANGVLQELFGIGDITITFDRPTHRESFVLAGIKDPDEIGLYLGDTLDLMRHTTGSPVWYKTTDEAPQFRFTDELLPLGSGTTPSFRPV